MDAFASDQATAPARRRQCTAVELAPLDVGQEPSRKE